MKTRNVGAMKTRSVGTMKKVNTSNIGYHMKRILASLLCSFGLTGPAHGQTLSPDQFTQVVVKAIRQAQPANSVTIKGKLELAIQYPEGKGAVAYLDNAYSKYLSDPAGLEEILQKYIAALADMQKKATAKTVAIDRTRIVPIVKDRHWLAEVRKSLKGGKQAIDNVYEDYNEELMVIFAEDTDNNINYFSPKDLEKLDIPRDKLRELAIENLRRLLPKPQIRAGALASMITVGGDYEASLLLFDDLWANLPAVDGEIVVAVPTRDLLVFTGSHNQKGLEKIREFASTESRESAYRLSDKLFVYRNGHFVRWGIGTTADK